MVSLEIDQRDKALEATMTALQARIGRWPLTHAFAVPDTSFYIEHQDKLEAVEPLAGRQVTLLTYDTGQATRGRAVGLQVRKLDKPHPEPEQAGGGANGAQKVTGPAAGAR